MPLCGIAKEPRVVMQNSPMPKRRAFCPEISEQRNCILLCRMTNTITHVQGLGVRESRQP